MTDRSTIGVVGLGLLGRDIVTCLAAHGHRVVAVDAAAEARDPLAAHVEAGLAELRSHGYAVAEGPVADRLAVGATVADLAGAGIVIESITEDLEKKQALFDEIESVVAEEAVIASNTSAIPITLIQQRRRRPERFVGMHWGEPAHVLRFLEIIRGEATCDEAFDTIVELAKRLGKEPSLVKRDIRGFVTNRLMYAMIREALHLLESGVADVETIDRSFRNDMGWWATFAGPFRWMDLTGLPAYAAVMRDLLPELSCQKSVPQTMRRLVESGARGVFNGRGFYQYSPEEAAELQRKWVEFSWEIRRLAEEYVPTPGEPEGRP